MEVIVVGGVFLLLAPILFLVSVFTGLYALIVVVCGILLIPFCWWFPFKLRILIEILLFSFLAFRVMFAIKVCEFFSSADNKDN